MTLISAGGRCLLRVLCTRQPAIHAEKLLVLAADSLSSSAFFPLAKSVYLGSHAKILGLFEPAGKVEEYVLPLLH